MSNNKNINTIAPILRTMSLSEMIETVTGTKTEPIVLSCPLADRAKEQNDLNLGTIKFHKLANLDRHLVRSRNVMDLRPITSKSEDVEYFISTLRLLGTKTWLKQTKLDPHNPQYDALVIRCNILCSYINLLDTSDIPPGGMSLIPKRLRARHHEETALEESVIKSITDTTISQDVQRLVAEFTTFTYQDLLTIHCGQVLEGGIRRPVLELLDHKYLPTQVINQFTVDEFPLWRQPDTVQSLPRYLKAIAPWSNDCLTGQQRIANFIFTDNTGIGLLNGWSSNWVTATPSTDTIVTLRFSQLTKYIKADTTEIVAKAFDELKYRKTTMTYAEFDQLVKKYPIRDIWYEIATFSRPGSQRRKSKRPPVVADHRASIKKQMAKLAQALSMTLPNSPVDIDHQEVFNNFHKIYSNPSIDSSIFPLNDISGIDTPEHHTLLRESSLVSYSGYVSNVLSKVCKLDIDQRPTKRKSRPPAIRILNQMNDVIGLQGKPNSNVVSLELTRTTAPSLVSVPLATYVQSVARLASEKLHEINVITSLVPLNKPTIIYNIYDVTKTPQGTSLVVPSNCVHARRNHKDKRGNKEHFVYSDWPLVSDMSKKTVVTFAISDEKPRQCLSSPFLNKVGTKLKEILIRGTSAHVTVKDGRIVGESSMNYFTYVNYSSNMLTDDVTNVVAANLRNFAKGKFDVPIVVSIVREVDLRNYYGARASWKRANMARLIKDQANFDNTELFTVMTSKEVVSKS